MPNSGYTYNIKGLQLHMYILPPESSESRSMLPKNLSHTDCYDLLVNIILFDLVMSSDGSS